MEKLVFNRLYNFLEDSQCIFSLQFGFRKKHSTNHALVEITENIRKALDENNFACGVFVDFQKAFDTVNHDILINKLDHYGVRGIENNWFRSYLTDRTQFVSILGFDSNTKPVSHGVPQYLGVYIDEHLNGRFHCNLLLNKLKRANGMLSKARHIISLTI